MRTRLDIVTDLAMMERAWEQHLPIVEQLLKDPESDIIMEKFTILALIYLTHRQRQNSRNASLHDFCKGVGLAYTMAESYKNLVDAFPNKVERQQFYDDTIQKILSHGLIKP